MLQGTRISYNYVDYGDETAYYGGPYEDLVTNLVAAPSVEWMEKSAAKMSGRYNNDHVTYASQEANRRQIRLATGGKAIRQRSTLFSLSTALNVDRNLFMQYSHPLADFEDGMPMHSMMDAGDPPMTVPPEQIALGAVGNLGSDGNLWTVLLAGQEYVITPTVAGGLAEGRSAAFNANASQPTSSADSAKNIAGPPLPTAPQYQLIHLTEHQALTDTNRARLNLGVGEEVDFSGLPDDTNTVWSVSAGGLDRMTGGGVKFTAPSNAPPGGVAATVTAKAHGQQLKVDFSVMEPTLHGFSKIEATNHFFIGYVGAGMIIDVWMQPFNVSFYRVYTWELPAGITNVSGYFTNSNNYTILVPNEGSTMIAEDNGVADDASEAFYPRTPPYAGGWDYVITNMWTIPGSSLTNYLGTATVNLRLLNTNGDFSITKFGQTITRSTNDVSY